MGLEIAVGRHKRSLLLLGEYLLPSVGALHQMLVDAERSVRTDRPIDFNVEGSCRCFTHGSKYFINYSMLCVFKNCPELSDDIKWMITYEKLVLFISI